MSEVSRTHATGGGDADKATVGTQVEWHNAGSEVRPTLAIIIEKRPLIRDLLLRCLTWASGFDAVGVATVEESKKFASALEPRLVLVSLMGSPESEGNQSLMKSVAQIFARTPVVVLSDFEDLQQVLGVLRSGSRGYISTGMSLDVAVEALRLVKAGGQFLPANCVIDGQPLTANDSDAAAQHATAFATGMFTPRQTSVVDALRRGKANKIIAYELNMRESTVKVHVRNIMKRLKAKNRTEVAYIINQLPGGAEFSES